MSSTGSTHGGIHRYRPARESTAAAITIVLLTVIEVVFAFLLTYGFVSGWGLTDMGNMFLGGIPAVVFVDLAFILTLYRRESLPDVMTVKRWRRKREDLYIYKEDVDGATASSDDAWEQVKRAVYPYYKR